jgi:hypothetical protein
MMPEPDRTPAPDNDDSGEAREADASLLFAPDQEKAEPLVVPTPTGPAPDAAPAAGYDMEPVDRPERPARAAMSGTGSESAPRDDIPARDRPRPDSSRVAQVWTRWAEWGPTLGAVAAAILATAALTWLLFDLDNLAPSVLALSLGLVATLILSYPLVITLERPVRMTPEQAVNDFLGALEHHRPHYRRMWLLLSENGRTSGSYGSFEGFRRYWAARLRTLRGSRVGPYTPLVFRVEGFKGPKSAGLDTTQATFSVVIHARGRRAEAPLANLDVRMTFSRGPDRQWYLDQGTLPEA